MYLLPKDIWHMHRINMQFRKETEIYACNKYLGGVDVTPIDGKNRLSFKLSLQLLKLEAWGLLHGMTEVYPP